LRHELHCDDAMHQEPERKRTGTVNRTGHMAGQELQMKKSWIGASAALMLSISALAHAQGVATPGAPTQSAATPVASTSVAMASTGTAWNGSDSPQITRAEVRHDLVHAERDGQLKTLDSTVYAHH
jgi:hypothetical protein